MNYKLMGRLFSFVFGLVLMNDAASSSNYTAGQAHLESSGEISVKTLPIKGIKKITLSNGDVSYMSSDGRFLFKGTLVDLWTGNNIEQLEVHAVGDWKRTGINPDDISISFGQENKKTIQVFVAPECGDCLDLARKLTKDPVNELNIQFILLSSSTNGTLLNSNIWCSPDKRQAFSEFFTGGKKLKDVGSCNTMALMTANAVAKFFHISQLPAVLDDKQQVATGSLEELVEFINNKREM